jgi:glycosyltransferase involved in cell wall biosynthesis
MPTHNRAHELPRTFRGLGAQTLPADQYELILVADGCRDNTVEIARHADTPFRLKLLEQFGQGAAAARNRGVEVARAPLILFLDDDMEAVPDLLRAHIEAHARMPGNLVLGYFPLRSEEVCNDPWAVGAKRWWDDGFAARLSPGYRFSFKDFCTGNISLPVALFHSLGGFCEDLPSAEDWEFGVRCMKRGIRFQFSKEAASIHHGVTNLKSALRRKHEEGLSHVLLVRRHPELFWCFNLHRLSRFQAKPRIWHLIWAHPRMVAFTSLALHALVRAFFAIGLSAATMAVYRLIEGERYWRGVYEEVKSLNGWNEFVQLAENAPQIGYTRIDIADEWHCIDQRLEKDNVQAVQLERNGKVIGHIRPVPGAERLSGMQVREECLARYSSVLLDLLLNERADQIRLCGAEAPSAGGRVGNRESEPLAPAYSEP